MIKIDKNVPLPSKAQRKYPFPDMERGDSFFVGGAVRNTLSTAAAKATKGIDGVKFTTRAVTENGVQGYRIWRVA